jgi:hypothetical protein
MISQTTSPAAKRAVLPKTNKVKVLKRRCYEITNLTRQFQQLFLNLDDYC